MIAVPIVVLPDFGSPSQSTLAYPIHDPLRLPSLGPAQTSHRSPETLCHQTSFTLKSSSISRFGFDLVDPLVSTWFPPSHGIYQLSYSVVLVRPQCFYHVHSPVSTLSTTQNFLKRYRLHFGRGKSACYENFF